MDEMILANCRVRIENRHVAEGDRIFTETRRLIYDLAGALVETGSWKRNGVSATVA